MTTREAVIVALVVVVAAFIFVGGIAGGVLISDALGAPWLMVFFLPPILGAFVFWILMGLSKIFP